MHCTAIDSVIYTNNNQALDPKISGQLWILEVSYMCILFCHSTLSYPKASLRHLLNWHTLLLVPLMSSLHLIFSTLRFEFTHFSHCFILIVNLSTSPNHLKLLIIFSSLGPTPKFFIYFESNFPYAQFFLFVYFLLYESMYLHLCYLSHFQLPSVPNFLKILLFNCLTALTMEHNW